METKKFVYYQEEDMFVGWLEEFPDYRTQGESLDELKENLADIYRELTSGRTSPSVPPLRGEGGRDHPHRSRCGERSSAFSALSVGT